MNTTFTRLLGCGAIAAAACLAQSRTAQGAVIDVNFQGPQQTFTAEVTGGGNLFASGEGNGPGKGGKGTQTFVFTEPLNHPLTLLDDLTINGGVDKVTTASTPRSVALPKINAPYRLDHTKPPAKVGDPPIDVFVYYDPSTGDGVDPYSSKVVTKEVDGAQVPITFTIDGGVPSVAPPSVFGYSQTQLTANGQVLSNIKNLDLDISNGVGTNFALSQVKITSNSPNFFLAGITLDVQGTLKDLNFQQTGDAVLNPTGIGTGTFSIGGTLSAVAGNLKAIAFELLDIPVDDQDFSQDFALSGTYHIIGSPNDPNAKIVLEGINNFSINLATVTSLAFEDSELIPLTISAAVDLAASINFNVGFHLERVGVIPEPGSIVLLALGVVSMLPVWMHRRRKQRQS